MKNIIRISNNRLVYVVMCYCNNIIVIMQTLIIEEL